MKPTRTLSVAVAATVSLTSGTADAATYTAVLKQVASWSGGGSSALNISSSTATWVYDDATGLLSQTGGTFNVRFSTSPNGSTLFRHSITGLVIGSGAAATASTFTCTEGDFGGNVGASICGNYYFGANFANESTVTWGPGTATSRTFGGDDMANGPVESLARYDAFTFRSWVGTTLTLANARCNPFAPGAANGCTTSGPINDGYTWILEAGPQVVPVPAAAWLFGSGLVALGLARRKQRSLDPR